MQTPPTSGLVIGKAYGYVTRVRGGVTQALVFRHPDPAGGYQIPKGTIEPGETAEQAVLRELWEETGLRDLRLVREVAVDLYTWEGELHERHFFHLTCDEPRDAWDHAVSGAGEETGLVFSYFWVSAPDEVPLLANHGDYLHLALAATTNPSAQTER